MLQTSISVDEYLSTAYHPDVDYLDGFLEERNVGEKEHGKLQRRVANLLERQGHLIPFIETRLRISPTRYRIPDVCAYHTEPDEAVFTQPPALCIEILSPEDRPNRTSRLIQDYFSIGVPSIWVFDPIQKQAFAADFSAELHRVTGSISTADQTVVLTLDEIFSSKSLF
jgi:Uma2 family endonuclease